MPWLRKKLLFWLLKDCFVGSWVGETSFPVIEDVPGNPKEIRKTGKSMSYLVFDHKGRSVSFGIEVKEMAQHQTQGFITC